MAHKTKTELLFVKMVSTWPTLSTVFKWKQIYSKKSRLYILQIQNKHFCYSLYDINLYKHKF